MSYAICRMQKMKSHDLKGMQFHNQRERESKTNPDIDSSRSHLNYDLVNQEKIDYNKRVKEIIDSQISSTRKIRKDAVLVNELIITSDRGFFDGLSEKEQKRFFEESYKLFSERYGTQNIAYATVHFDEKTPHLHMGVVPMKDGKLQGKNVFNRQELQWIQDEFPKHLREKGFEVERGEKGSDREHLTTQELKAKTIQVKINNLENQLGGLTNLQTKIEKIEDFNSKIKEKRFSDKVVMDKKDYKAFEELAKSGFVVREKFEEHKKASGETIQELTIENKNLKKERNDYMDKNQELRKKNRELKQENSELKRELRRYITLVKTFGDQVKIRMEKLTEKLQLPKLYEVFKHQVFEPSRKYSNSEYTNEKQQEQRTKANELEME